MNKWIALLFFICFSENLHGAESKSPLLIVVVGAPGESEFEGRFQQWATNWKNLCRKTQVDFQDVGLSPTNQVADKEQFKSLLTTAATNSLLELWIVLIGHGTFDGKEAKFNLRGPDFSSMELLDWIKPIKLPCAPFIITISFLRLSITYYLSLNGLL